MIMFDKSWKKNRMMCDDKQINCWFSHTKIYSMKQQHKQKALTKITTAANVAKKMGNQMNKMR